MASACSGVLTIGQITPNTPASRIFISSAGSFQVTRARGMVLVVDTACSMVTAVW